MKILAKKRMLAFALAATMVVPFALSACNNNNSGSGDEDVWTITLNYNDDVHRNGAIVVDKEDGKVKVPKSPETEGNTFAGWYTEKDGGEVVDFATLKVNADMTVYAHWTPAIYDVTFDWNLSEVEYTNTVLHVPYNNTIAVEGVAEEYTVPMEKPENLTENQFIGWMSRADKMDDETAKLFPAVIKKPVTYYALWADADARTYHINYNVGNVGAATIPSASYTEGLSAIRLPRSSAPGYDFKGWSLTAAEPTPDEVNGELPALTEYKPTGDELNITLHAVWQTHKYTVNFISQGETHSTLSNVLYGSKISKPATDPTRENYVFAGWYATETGGTAINFEEYTVPALDATGATLNIYARWRANGVVTTIFDAEFCPVADHNTPGYSGQTTTPYGSILTDGDGFGASTQHQPGSIFEGENGDVSYMYEPGYTLTFAINSSASTDATLVLRAAGEGIFTDVGADCTFTSADGGMCFKVKVNGVALEYGTFTVEADHFLDFTLGNIHLNEGDNVIELVVSNNTEYGGTAKAAAPIVDCIKINGASGELSWQPEYDNLMNR